MRQQKPFAAKWFPALAAFILTMTLAVGPGFAQMGRGRGFVTASLASKSMSWREPRKWKRRSETFSIRTLTAFRNQDDSEVDEEAAEFPYLKHCITVQTESLLQRGHIVCDSLWFDFMGHKRVVLKFFAA